MSRTAPPALGRGGLRVVGESSPMPTRFDELTDATTLEGVRAFLEDEGRASLAEIPFDYEFEPTAIGGVPCVWMTTPECERDENVLIFVHGGGYVAGSARSGASCALQVARGSRTRVLGVEYRLAPEHPFPAALTDLQTVWQALLRERAPARIGLFGITAGGGLAAAGLLAMRDAGGPLPAAVAIVSPQADLSLRAEPGQALDPGGTWKDGLAIAAAAYVGGSDPLHPYVSPVYGDYRALPPLLLQSGSREDTPSDAMRIEQAARRAGVDVRHDVWQGFWHAFHYSYSVPESRAACGQIASFLTSHLA